MFTDWALVTESSKSPAAAEVVSKLQLSPLGGAETESHRKMAAGVLRFVRPEARRPLEEVQHRHHRHRYNHHYQYNYNNESNDNNNNNDNNDNNYNNYKNEHAVAAGGGAPIPGHIQFDNLTAHPKNKTKY
jgi:hypothetical protein